LTTQKQGEMMAREQSDYLSYLLRLWRVNEEGSLHGGAKQVVWRASLENPHTRQRQGFASLDELFDFLREQTGAASGASGNASDEEIHD
jgi:hypothetical protein